MKNLTRSVLAKAFPDNPRLRSEMEKLDELLSRVDDKGRTLTERLEVIADGLDNDGQFQRASTILEAIANLPDRVGAIEITAAGQAAVRPIDGHDPASLLSRGVGYTVFVGIGGRGTTAQRPVLPAQAAAIYFDIDMDPDGQPIFWTGIMWVDAQGIPV